MNAVAGTLPDRSVIPLGTLPESARAVCCRLDAVPCEAGEILSPREMEHWTAMRAVEKRRHEWLLGRCAAKDAVRLLLDLTSRRQDIEITTDAFGCPKVAGATISIAHSRGVAVALAACSPDSDLLVGIDLESLDHRRQDFESIAFHQDERSLLAALPPESRQEWALRMWCAKESVGKALGRGLSAGLLAFRIRDMQTATGSIQIELRDGALQQFPRLRGKLLTVNTARESKFVFSAIIYQHGAVRMRPSRQEILDYLLHKMGELTQDWDYPDPVRPESLLFTELGFESLDAVVLCTAIQEHYQTPMPFAELLAEIGQQQRDLSIDELTSFVHTHLGGPAASEPVSRRLQ